MKMTGSVVKEAIGKNFRVYVIHSNCVRLHNFFFFMMDYGENGYLHAKM